MSQHHHGKRSVYVVNGAKGPTWTTRRSAKRYVDQGRARWADQEQSVIEFYPSDYRHLTAIAGGGQRTAEHSPSLEIIQREIGIYRNDVLGLPNFVGIIRDRRATHSRRLAA